MDNSIYKFNYFIGSSIISFLYEFNENLILKNKDENNLLIKCDELIKKLNDLKEIKLREKKLNEIYLNCNFKFKIIDLLSENKNFRSKNNYKLLREINNKLIIEVYHLINQNETTKEIKNSVPTPSDICSSKIKKEKPIDSLNNHQKSNLILLSDDNSSNSECDSDSNELEGDGSSGEQSESSNFSNVGSNLTIRNNPSLSDRENQESNNQWKEHQLLPDEYKSILKQIKSSYFFRKIHQNDLDLVFDVVKYLKYNFIIEKKDHKARPNFIIKKCLYGEIESVINLRKSNFFRQVNLGFRLNSIILFTFQNNPELCSAHYRFRDPDGQISFKKVYKNMKRKNSNNFSNINDDISEDESTSGEDKEWKKYKLSPDEQLKIEKKIENHRRFNCILKSDKKLIFDIIKYLRYNFVVEKNNEKSKYIIKENLKNEIKSAIDINKSNLSGNSENSQSIILGLIIKFAFNDNPNFYATNIQFLKDDKLKNIGIYKNLKRINHKFD